MDWAGFFPGGTPVLALPTWKAPRVLLAADTGIRQRWQESDFLPAFLTRAKVFRAALRCLASVQASGTLRVAREPDEWPLHAFAGDVLPGMTSVVVRFGTDAPTRKLTAQIRDRSGAVIGYVKYAETPRARERLARERRILERLPPGIGPALLKSGAWRNGEALVLSPVHGEHPQADSIPVADILGLTDGLVRDGPREIAQHPWAASLAARWGDTIAADLSALSGRGWPVVIQHGDLAPWNLLVSSSGSAAAIDWEFGELDGFPHLDHAYYLLQVAALIRNWPPEAAAGHCVQHLVETVGLTAPEARSLTRLAAFDAMSKAAADGIPAGNKLQAYRRAIWERPW